MSKNKPKLKFDEDYRMLVLSTCHVSEEDSNLLSVPSKRMCEKPIFLSVNNPLTRFVNEYGWMIKLWYSGALEEFLEDIRLYGYSDKMIEFVSVLHKQGFSYLALDRDAEVSEHFTTYDW